MAGSTAGAIAITSPSNVRSGQASDTMSAGWPTRTRPRCSAATWAATSTRSTFATSRSGWAAVPSTCSPTPTKRFTTWPEIGDRTCARASCRSAVARAASACSRPGLGRRALGARVLDLLARGDPPLEEPLGAGEVEPGVLERGLRLGERGPRLPLLVLERRRLDLRHHLPRPDAVALGHAHRDDPAGHLRGDLHVLVRRRGDRAAHEERLDQVPPRDRAGLGRDRRHLGRDDLLVAPRAGAGGKGERQRQRRRRGGRERMRLYSIGPPSTSSRSASAD